MTMRFRSGVERDDARYLKEPSLDYLRIDVPDADGTVSVRHGRSSSAAAASEPATRRVRRVIRLIQPVIDLIAALVAVTVSGVLGPVDGVVDGAALVGTSVTFPLTLGLLGAYRRSVATNAGTVMAAVGVTSLLGAVVGTGVRPFDLRSRLIMLALVLLLGHVVLGAIWAKVRRTSRVGSFIRIPTVVISGSAPVGAVVDVLREVESELDPVRVIEHRGNDEGLESLTTTVDRAIRDTAAECLLVTDATVSASDLDALRRVARLRGADMHLSVGVPETLPSTTLGVRAGGRHAIVALPMANSGAGPAFAKRAIDIVLGTIGLVVTMPLMIAIAVAIKVTSPGPVLFRQERVKKGKETFRILKFRTMEHQARVDDDVTRPFFKMQDDPRLTKVGRVLRTQSLDELPQLWNVLKGDMSLVGPRPLPLEQVLAHPELLGPRHEVAPGMTGWWQVNGRSDLPAEEAVAYDHFYVENWSVWLDLRIIVKTAAVLLTRRGAY